MTVTMQSVIFLIMILLHGFWAHAVTETENNCTSSRCVNYTNCSLYYRKESSNTTSREPIVKCGGCLEGYSEELRTQSTKGANYSCTKVILNPTYYTTVAIIVLLVPIIFVIIHGIAYQIRLYRKRSSTKSPVEPDMPDVPTNGQGVNANNQPTLNPSDVMDEGQIPTRTSSYVSVPGQCFAAIGDEV